MKIRDFFSSPEKLDLFISKNPIAKKAFVMDVSRKFLTIALITKNGFKPQMTLNPVTVSNWNIPNDTAEIIAAEKINSLDDGLFNPQDVISSEYNKKGKRL